MSPSASGHGPAASFAAPFVVAGPSGTAIRDRLRGLTAEDDQVLRSVGAHLGALAGRDLRTRCADGLSHDADRWAVRKRELTGESSARWAGSITKATHDQWALARRGRLAHMRSLEAGVRTLEHRLSLPIGEPGTKRAPGGYRSRGEWFVKSRRLEALKDRLTAERADWDAGRVRVVRGGRRLLNARHHLDETRLTENEWRQRWEAERWFLQADGEAGKRYGNETIRVTPGGEISIRLPAPLAHLANAPRRRYVLTARVAFPRRGTEWADRVEGNRAVSYRIHLDVERGRWYLTASWRRAAVPTVPLEAPPRPHQSDDGGHRTVQADHGDRGREGPRHPVTERAPDARPRTRASRTRATSVSNTVRDACRTGTRVQIPLPDTVEER